MSETNFTNLLLNIACVYMFVFGNTASPAIAAYDLRLAGNHSCLRSNVSDFVCRDFYVDNELKLLPIIE